MDKQNILMNIKEYNPTEQELSLIEFLCQYAKHDDGSSYIPITALNETRTAFKFDDTKYTIRPINSVDNQEHTWTFNN